LPVPEVPPGPAELTGMFIADVTQSLGRDLAGSPPDPATSTADQQLDWLAGHLDADADDGARVGGPHRATPGGSTSRDALLAQLRRRLGVYSAFSARAGMLAGYRPAGPTVKAPAPIVS